MEPDVLESRDGVLDVDLVAAPTMVDWGTGQRWALAYNGTVPGPTWRIRPGDRVRVHVRNGMDEPTNLHTHGLHVSPSGASDDPFVMIEPGGVHDYEYEIPADHPAGTFWYHPHHHGRVAPQVAGGLAGVIIVDDGTPPALLDGGVERVLVLSDPKIGTTSAVLDISAMEVMAGRTGDGPLVNGQVTPVLTVPAGTRERWRIVNASASRYYGLAVDGLSWRQVAVDGGLLEVAWKGDEVSLAPGERIELLVAIGPSGGSLVSRAVSGSTAMMGGGMGRRTRGSTATSDDVLMRVVATGSEVAPAVDGPLATVERLDESSVTGSRRFALAMGMGMMGGDGFTIDGRTFDAARVDTTVTLGHTEDWTIANASPMSHPFHLHVWPFQVVERSDGRAAPLGWKDTVDVPAGGSVKVRVRFADLGGRTVYHCHILDHEDHGMMGIIEAV